VLTSHSTSEDLIYFSYSWCIIIIIIIIMTIIIIIMTIIIIIMTIIIVDEIPRRFPVQNSELTVDSNTRSNLIPGVVTAKSGAKDNLYCGTKTQKQNRISYSTKRGF
jgi:hypothetical protein